MHDYVAGVKRCPRQRLSAIVVLAVLLLVSCGQRGAVEDSLDRSTTPLLVPTGEWRDGFEFTAPPGATDLYQLQWNFTAGATDVVTGWQIASTTSYDQALIAEGPGQELVDEALRASRGEECVVADVDLELQLCAYPSEFARDGVNAYLVRLVENQILVIGYNNLNGDRTVYSPLALESRFIAGDFEPIPIDSDIDRYLVYIY